MNGMVKSGLQILGVNGLDGGFKGALFGAGNCRDVTCYVFQ